MIIKVLDFKYKKVKIPVSDEAGNTSFIEEEIRTKDYRILRREINFIDEFSEFANEKGQIYKSRCLLKEPHGDWLVVNHSFDELHKLKNRKVVGFMKNLKDYEESSSFEKIKKNESKQKFRSENKRTSKKPRNKRRSS